MEDIGDDDRSWIEPQRKVTELEWGAFFLLMAAAVAIGVAAGGAIFYYLIFKNVGP